MADSIDFQLHPDTRLLVLGPGTRAGFFRCRCACNHVGEYRKSKLVSGHTKSCGCLSRESLGARRLAIGRWKGLGRKKTFVLWRGMIARCHAPYATGYYKYGARGITVCDKWRQSYPAFYADMGDAPDGMQIDRKDNDGPYSPENCRWASPKEQARNRRSTKFVTFQGRTQCLNAWAEELGVNREALAWRIRTWGVEKALSAEKPKGHARVYLTHLGVTKPRSEWAKEFGVSTALLGWRVSAYGVDAAFAHYLKEVAPRG